MATVSRYINGTGNVSEHLRWRVARAIEELGYQPNAVAKSLRNRQTKMVGVLISDISNPFFASVVRGIEDVLSQKGFTVVLCNTDTDPRKEAQYVSELLQRRIDGLIVSAASSESEHFLPVIKQKLPLVFVNRVPTTLDSADAVLTNNVKGAYMATEHLISLQHRRIGAIVGPQDVITGKERLEGYCNALSDHALTVRSDYIKEGDFRRESGYELLGELLDLPAPPTAVFVANNQMTLGALEKIQELGLSVPRDISLIGFDFSDWMRVVRPRITTIVQPSYQLGQVAAELLLKRHSEKRSGSAHAKPKVIKLEPKFLRGGSTSGVFSYEG